MSTRGTQIHNAVGDALDYLQASFAMPETQPDLDLDGYSMEHLSDYTVLNIDDEITPGPDQLVLDGYGEIYAALRSFNYFLGGNIPEEDIKADVLHEKEHTDASRTVGFQQARYLLTLTANTPDERGYYLTQHAFDPIRPVTKLALAATIAAPRNPSIGDNIRLELMGFNGGVSEIARRVRRNNERANRPALPLPGTLYARH
jgi:hypothetical protein